MVDFFRLALLALLAALSFSAVAVPAAIDYAWTRPGNRAGHGSDGPAQCAAYMQASIDYGNSQPPTGGYQGISTQFTLPNTCIWTFRAVYANAGQGQTVTQPADPQMTRTVTCPTGTTLAADGVTCNSPNETEYCATQASGTYAGPRASVVQGYSGIIGTTISACVGGLGPMPNGSTASCAVTGEVTMVAKRDATTSTAYFEGKYTGIP